MNSRTSHTWNPPMRLFLLTLLLVGGGIVAVFSASMDKGQMFRQVIYALIGLTGMSLAYLIDYRVYRKLSFPLMMIGLLLCAFLLIPSDLVVEIKGARRWIRILGFSLQPSEFAKFALVIYMAKMISDNQRQIRTFFSGVVPACIVLGAYGLLILIEPDFGAAFTLFLVIFGMWVAGGMRWFHLLGLWFLAIPVGVMGFLLEPYRMKRLFAFLNPDSLEVRRGTGWQLWQSLIAVGTGGAWGQGLGNGMQKHKYLGEAHNDFIFAIVCEEVGFAGVSVFLFLYVMLIFHGWMVAWKCTDLFGSMLATGITLMIFISASIHMGVVLGLLPTKGLVLPLISAGGTSLIMTMTAVGVLMNIAKCSYVQQSLGMEKGRW